jgi:hypothetical protein
VPFLEIAPLSHRKQSSPLRSLSSPASKSDKMLVSQFCHLARDGCRYEVNVSGRGWATPAQRGERGEHRSALQSVPRNRGGPAESGRGTQRKVGNARDGEQFPCFDKLLLVASAK